MRGHMAIKELRRMGKKPSQAWVFLLEPDAKMPQFVDAEDLLESGLPPEVHIDAKERIGTLDFRFLTGVIVHLQGQNVDRLRQAYAQILPCQPLRIIASGAGVFHDTGMPTCTT
ncbi:hypothetical protein [Allopusillimonas ginsengisoli]|uniref:hypothetical protein n=1 Tax=Allopusillimonas ginsengisoli TaxID=453575 RepID=UPI00102087DD|nr:hypothetical protein [Allopusillimonas ginsengisoli]TEA78658.1 hypothetical protein ERE07_09690 [Allopusillimonas ginsengisoli]